MIEIWSRVLAARELIKAVEGFRRASGFRENKDTESIIEFAWKELNPLTGYRLVPGSRVWLSHEATTLDKLPALVSLAHGGRAAPGKRLVTLELEIAECGKAYKLPESSDLCWLFCSSIRGLTITVTVGDASRGSSSVTERLDVFSGAIEILGLGHEVVLSTDGGKLRIADTGGRIKIVSGADRVSMDPPFVVPNACELDKTNFTTLDFVGVFSHEDLPRLVDSVVARYSACNIRAVELGFSCYPDGYEAVRQYVEASALSWRVRMQVENPFRLRDLERAMEDTSEFNFLAFTIRLKKVGLMHAELSGENGRYRMRFVPEKTDPAVEEVAVPLLEELSGLGVGFLEREA